MQKRKLKIVTMLLISFLLATALVNATSVKGVTTKTLDFYEGGVGVTYLLLGSAAASSDWGSDHMGVLTKTVGIGSAYAESWIMAKFTAPNYPDDVYLFKWQVDILGVLWSAGTFASSSISVEIEIFDGMWDMKYTHTIYSASVEGYMGGLPWLPVPVPNTKPVDTTVSGEKALEITGGTTYYIRIITKAVSNSFVAYGSYSHFYGSLGTTVDWLKVTY